MKRPRVLSVPPVFDHTNTYMLSWYGAADAEVVLQGKSRISLGLTVFNPFYLWKHREEFDHFHVQWEIRLARMPLVVASVLLCKMMGKNVLWTAHEPLPHQGIFSFRAWLTGLFLARLADHIIVHNEFTASEVKRLFAVNKSINIIDIPDYKIHPVGKTEAKSRINEDRFIFLYFGYIKWYKGVDILCQHFSSRKLDAVLYVIGHFGWTPEGRDTVNLNRNGLIFRAENLPDEILDLYISAADVVVMPYRKCYTSAAAHRALQLGKFLVVSKAVGRTLDPSDRIIQYDRDEDLADALMAARKANTDALPPRTILNFEQPDYRRRVQSFYRQTTP